MTIARYVVILKTKDGVHHIGCGTRSAAQSVIMTACVLLPEDKREIYIRRGHNRGEDIPLKEVMC